MNERIARYSVKNSIRDEVAPLIFKEIISKPQFSCVIDKVTGTANSVYYDTYSDCNPLFYEKEVYFLLDKKNISTEVISKCLRASTSFWHSLCVFTTADFAGVIKFLSKEKIEEICLKTELIMIGAYDGEGYVFWEKNRVNVGRGFFE